MPASITRKPSSYSSCCKQRRGDRPGVHHQHVGPPLIELQLVALFLGMAPHKGEQPQVSRRVAGTRLVHLQVPEAQVAVVILDALPPQPQAILLAEHKGRRVRVRLIVGLLLVLVIVQPRLEALGRVARRAGRPSPSGGCPNPPATGFCRGRRRRGQSAPAPSRDRTATRSGLRDKSLDMPALYAAGGEE